MTAHAGEWCTRVEEEMVPGGSRHIVNYTIRGESLSGLPSPGDKQTSPAVAGQLIANLCVAGVACGMAAKYPIGYSSS